MSMLHLSLYFFIFYNTVKVFFYEKNPIFHVLQVIFFSKYITLEVTRYDKCGTSVVNTIEGLVHIFNLFNMTNETITLRTGQKSERYNLGDQHPCVQFSAKISSPSQTQYVHQRFFIYKNTVFIQGPQVIFRITFDGAQIGIHRQILTREKK